MKKILKTIVLCALAIFASCSEDIYDSHINDSSTTNRNKISLKQFKQETNIKDFKPYYKVPISANSVSSRTAQLSEFVIDTVAIQKYISENNKTTYSFRIYSIVSSTQLDEKYNLVYTKENNVWEQVIVAFKEKLNATPTENQFEDLQKLYDSRFSYVTTSIASLVCISEGTLAHCTHTGPCESGRCDGCFRCITRILIVDFCEGSPGVGTPNPGNPPIDYSGAGYIPINPFEFTPNLFDNPVFDDPNYINAIKAQQFFDHLYLKQMWVSATTENTKIYLQLIQYQIDNNWSPESETFANELINQMMANPELNLDVDASSKSPCFIDLSSVSGSTPEEIKFNEVYNSLKNSPTFRLLFTNLFGSTPLFNTKFLINNIPQTGQGHTDGTCTLYVSQNNPAPFNVITIDRSHLLTKSKSNVAITIIHECIHAYLNIKFKNPSIGMSLADINNMDFKTIVNLYYNGFSGNQSQHSFFINYMIPSMVQILQDVKSSLFTPAQISAVENPEPNAEIYEVTPTTPSSLNYNVVLPWNWANYFTHACYNGLQNTTDYPDIYPQDSPNFLNYSQYVSIGIFIFNP